MTKRPSFSGAGLVFAAGGLAATPFRRSVAWESRVGPSGGAARALGFVLVFVLGLSPASAFADDLKKILDLPLSPGSIALLAKRSQEPAVVARLKGAITNPDAQVRGAAARVIGLAASADLLPDVKTALASEQDIEAAREEIRTLCAVGGSRYDAAILEASRRFAPRLDGEVVRIFGRVRGIEALPLYFSTLRDLTLSPFDRKAFFRIASRGNRDLLIAAGAIALGRDDAANWQAILAVASEMDSVLEENVLLQALRSRNTVFRGETSWYLAKAYQQKPPRNPTEVLQAVSEENPPATAAADPELRFGSEMLRRVLGRPPIEDEAWIACLATNPDCHLDSDFLQSPLVEYLTPREREAITRRNETHLPPEAKSKSVSDTGLSTKPPEATAPEVSLRLVSGLPRGTGADLIRVGGCQVSALVQTPSGRPVPQRSFSSAEIEFRTDGLPKHVSLGAMPQRPECGRVAEAIFLMSMAPEDAPVSSRSRFLYIGLLDPECLACSEVTDLPEPGRGRSAEVVRVRARVQPPKLIEKPAPIYPETSRKKHEQGVSIYEAIITPTGCVRDIRVLRSSYPLLDLNGMEAIARWRYKPALLDDRPVSVYLTVTVTYNLRL